MARARLLKPGFFTNAKLGALSPHCRLLFAGLWTLADREGRLKDEPLAIKGAIFPFEAVDTEELMKLLTKAGFIRRYRVKAERYVQIVNFLKHQTPHVKEAASTIPAPDEHSASTAFSGTSPSVTETVPIAVTETEAKAEAVTRPPVFTPVPVEDRSFSSQYVWHQEQRTGLHPGGATVAAASQLERDYGLDACVQVAADLNWEKHPNYMRPILEERRNGNGSGEGRGKSAAAEGAGGVAGGVSGLDRRRAAIAARG